MNKLIIYLNRKDLDFLKQNVGPLEWIVNGASYEDFGKAEVSMFKENIWLYFADEKHKLCK